jgi:hypothetical protein
MVLFFWAFGLTSIVLFERDVFVPIPVSLAVVALAGWYLFSQFRRSRVGPLSMLLFVVFTLPFIHLFPYLWFDFDAPAPMRMWGLATNPYMVDETIIKLTATIASVGAAGFAAGVFLVPQHLQTAGALPVLRQNTAKSLSLPLFASWTGVALLLSSVAAPAETLFTSRYTESAARSAAWNFSSAWLASHTFLVYALADAMFEPSEVIRSLKRRIFFYSTLLLVVWFQLLRGDRESLPLVVAALFMYYAWGKDLRFFPREKVRLLAPALLVLAVFFVAYLVGNLRHSLSGVESVAGFERVLGGPTSEGSSRFQDAFSGTWSAVLLTPLSVAGDYVNGAMPMDYGQTYVDLILSITPGFIADWVGYTRPIDAFHGPAWRMTYGQGGTHAVVLPFMAFRMAGVFSIVAAWSFATARIERDSVRGLTVQRLSLLGVVAMATPHWLWYGEKSIINALAFWLLLSFLYRAR